MVVGVHSPEFTHERDRDTVRRAAVRFKKTHPIYIDNDFGYWNALGNRYWPSFYLVDRTGHIRSHKIGEMHQGTSRAAEWDTLIQRLLAEDGPPPSKPEG